MDKRQQTGFTLYELLITLVVVAVILSFGIPNLRNFTLNSRITGAANDLHAAFMMARSEAARTKTSVTICASANPMGTAADCDGTWDQGYVVFNDKNADQQRQKENGETILWSRPAVDTGVILRVANAATYFTYAPSGLGQPAADNLPLSQVVICDERGNANGPGGGSTARLFVSTPLGRATIVRDKGMIGQALTDMDATCP
jgi:type IV fimbrial biogenesis protein FimT